MKDEPLLSQQIATSPKDSSVNCLASVGRDCTMSQDHLQQSRYYLCEPAMKSICSTLITGEDG
jgi:hypothetical protein